MTINLRHSPETLPMKVHADSGSATVPLENHPPRTGRVLVVVRWPVGGIRTHLVYNYPTLAAAGYRFTFVVPADETLTTLADSLADLRGAEFIGVPVKRGRCGLGWAVRRQLRTKRFDLIHSHGLTAAIHASLANLCLQYPHAATLHDVFRPSHFSGAAGILKRRTLGYLLTQIDTLLAVSDDVRANLIEYVPSQRKRASSLLTISNGIKFRAEPLPAPGPCHDLRAHLGLYGHVRLVGFLGRFMEQKGFLPLLYALRELNDKGHSVPYHLVAVGSGDYRREYTGVIRRLGLANRVTLLDFMPDVRPVLGQLDLLVIPSLWEASSLLGMEAMLAGVPVLGTDCIGLREVLRDTPARTVPPGDVHALALGLEAALENLWTDAARAFVPTAWERFDNGPSARKLLGVFDRLLHQDSRH